MPVFDNFLLQKLNFRQHGWIFQSAPKKQTNPPWLKKNWLVCLYSLKFSLTSLFNFCLKWAGSVNQQQHRRQKARTPSQGTSVDWNSRKRNVKLQSVQCTLWPQTPKRPLLFLLSFSAMWLPVIYLLPEHVGPFAQHSSACPPQHMKASATAVLDGAKWVPDGKVFCVYVCVCVSSHIREQLLLYKWPESHPQGNVGETVQDGREHVGVAYCMWKHVRYPQRSWYALDLYVLMLAHGQKCRLVLHYALSTITAETQKELLWNWEIATATLHMCKIMPVQYSSKAID